MASECWAPTDLESANCAGDLPGERQNGGTSRASHTVAERTEGPSVVVIPPAEEDGQVHAGVLDQATETIAASRELIRTSQLLIASIRVTIAGSKRLCERQVAEGLFDLPARQVAEGTPATRAV